MRRRSLFRRSGVGGVPQRPQLRRHGRLHARLLRSRPMRARARGRRHAVRRWRHLQWCGPLRRRPVHELRRQPVRGLWARGMSGMRWVRPTLLRRPVLGPLDDVLRGSMRRLWRRRRALLPRSPLPGGSGHRLRRRRLHAVRRIRASRAALSDGATGVTCATARGATACPGVRWSRARTGRSASRAEPASRAAAAEGRAAPPRHGVGPESAAWAAARRDRGADRCTRCAAAAPHRAWEVSSAGPTRAAN